MKTFLINLPTFHHRLMANFLRHRGWVVFYLEEQARHCNGGNCWLKLYQTGCKATLHRKKGVEDEGE